MAASNDQHADQNLPEKNVAPPINYYQLLDKMIGNKKEKFTDVLVPNVGIPQPARSPQEVKIAAFFESCPFKSGLSCVAGMCSFLHGFVYFSPWGIKIGLFITVYSEHLVVFVR